VNTTLISCTAKEVPLFGRQRDRPVRDLSNCVPGIFDLGVMGDTLILQITEILQLSGTWGCKICQLAASNPPSVNTYLLAQGAACFERTSTGVSDRLCRARFRTLTSCTAKASLRLYPSLRARGSVCMEMWSIPTCGTPLREPRWLR
jgi:hypothetical protein